MIKNWLYLLVIATVIVCLPCSLQGQDATKDVLKLAGENVEKAHKEIWRRFVDEYSILIDFTGFDGKFDRPTPEEFKANKPNALAWWTPTENGSMFNGLYLDGICRRWQQSHKAEDAEKARKLVKGLLFLSSVGDNPGVICRAVATDGKTPPAMGSNDQTSPWFYGLWRYANSGIPNREEKLQVVAKMVEVANVLQGHNWELPTNSWSPAKYRNRLNSFDWEGAPRLLFVLKALGNLTGDKKWEKLYSEYSTEKGGEANRSRLEICAAGMHFEKNKVNRWTGVSSTVDLLALYEMETNTAMKKMYANGLNASANSAAEGLPLWHKYENDKPAYFLHDWRQINKWWKPQHSLQDALDVAQVQHDTLVKMSPRRVQELGQVREPIWMSWIITMAADKQIVNKHRSEILSALAYYHWDKLYYSQFFPVEVIWWRLQP